MLSKPEGAKRARARRNIPAPRLRNHWHEGRLSLSSHAPMTTTAAPSSATARDQVPFLAEGMTAVLAIAVFKLLLHCYFNNRYGYFRDEFDYIACGNHLAWGYVDQPPLIPFLTRVSLTVLGDSLRAVRFLPALASSAMVVLAAVIARELGGRRYALVLTAITVALAPQYLSNGSLLTTNCLEPLLWMGCAYFVILAVKRDGPRYWLWFGIVAGIGMEEKYSIAVFGFAIVVGLLLTPERRFLLDKWIWLGGIAAFLIFLPNFLWNMHYHWPFIELMHNIKTTGKNVELSAFQYFAQQFLLIGPLAGPVWITGLIALFVSARLKRYRLLGWSFLVAFTVFVVLKGKNYYLGPVYPMLLAAGAVTIESGLERTRPPWLKASLKPVIVVLLIASGLWLAPVVVPVLPVDQLLSYLHKLPFKAPRSEHSHTAALPQHYADQFGWQEMTAKVAEAWARLTPDDRRDCAIFAQDYGQAGAIDFFGSRYGLAPSVSGHQTYYLWGPHGHSGNCMIVLDDSREVLERLYESVEFVGTSDNPYALERNIPVFICKGSKFGTLAQLWPKVKKWR
jgi:hypothetical protein